MACKRTGCGGRVFLDVEFNELFCLRCGDRTFDKGEYAKSIMESMKESERIRNGLHVTKRREA